MNKLLIKIAVWLLKKVNQDRIVHKNSFNNYVGHIEYTEIHE